MLKRNRELGEDPNNGAKKPRIEISSVQQTSNVTIPPQTETNFKPTVLYQQYLPTGRIYGDIYFLTRDGTSYVTPLELAIIDEKCFEERRLEAGLPDSFELKRTVGVAGVPDLLVQVDKDTFVSGEALLPYALKIGKPLTEMFPKKSIYVRNRSIRGEPTYVEISKCEPLFQHGTTLMDEFPHRDRAYVLPNQRMQLGLDVRPYATSTSTTRDHAEAILEKIREPKWLAARFPARPPLFVYGDDDLFAEGAEIVSPSNGCRRSPGDSDKSKMFILSKPNWPEHGVDNPDVNRPHYKELSLIQRVKLEALRYHLRQHLGRLGMEQRWARELDDDERFFLGVVDRPDAPWSDKLRKDQKLQIGLIGETAKRYYVCQPTSPALARKTTSETVRNPQNRAECLARAEPGIYRDLRTYHKMLEQPEKYLYLERNTERVGYLVKYEDKHGTGYVRPQELKRLVGDQQSAEMLETAKIPQSFRHETRETIPVVLIDTGDGTNSLDGEKFELNLPEEEIPTSIAFDRILVETAHGNFMDLTRALALGAEINPTLCRKLGLPLTFGLTARESARTSSQPGNSVRSFDDRERGGLQR